MGSEWRDCTLGEIVELKRGYDLPQKDRSPGAVPLVSSSGVTDYHNVAMAKGPGVVTGRYGTLGKVYYITEDFWPLNTTLYVRDFKGNNPRFISYFLGGLDFFAYSDKAAVPGLNRNHLHQAKVRVPVDVFEQRAIAHILGTLDDKIELNRRMNEALEAMARALFTSWFVNLESDEIPEGWRLSTLGAEVERCGGTIQTGPFGSQLHASDYSEEGVPVVMPKDLSQRRILTDGIARVQMYHAERLARHRLRKGDIVYSRRGDVERHALVGPREVGWLCGTGCLLVRMGPDHPSPLFISIALDQPEIRAWITQHAIGATMPNLNTGILAAVPLVVPPDEVVRAFDAAIHPLAALIVANDAQSETLASLRDTLLPKLISGELRVGDAEKIVAGTV